MPKYSVKQLIEELQGLPEETKIVLASDEEGNDFGLLWSVEHDPDGKIVYLYPATGTFDPEE